MSMRILPPHFLSVFNSSRFVELCTKPNSTHFAKPSMHKAEFQSCQVDFSLPSRRSPPASINGETVDLLDNQPRLEIPKYHFTCFVTQGLFCVNRLAYHRNLVIDWAKDD